ncbi:MAG: response regulator transcription factor [Anaerolineae bacterium]|nr:response regulator transcription factor [Anaerolineae bacterium]
MSENKIRVAILEDHQTTVDGYIFRLSNLPNIEVVATASFGNELEALTSKHEIDILLLDVSVPTSAKNPNPYPILHIIPKLLLTHTELAVLVISMHNQRTLIKSVMEAGASGYILKDDRESIIKLGEIVASVANGGIYFSHESYRLISGQLEKEAPSLTLRQQEVLSLCTAHPNLTTAEIAHKLNIAPSTVRNLLSDTYIRLKVRNRSAAISKARGLGLITPFTPESDSK